MHSEGLQPLTGTPQDSQEDSGQGIQDIIARMLAMAKESPEPGSQQPAYSRFSDCELCDGTGWIYHDTYDENGVRTNTATEKCICRKHKENIRRMKASGLGHVLEELTFDTFIAKED